MHNIKGGIGYVESAYAEQNHLTTTQLRNKAGKFVTPTMDSFKAAAASADWSKVQNFAIDLNDQPGDNSWPIESRHVRAAADRSEGPEPERRGEEVLRLGLRTRQRYRRRKLLYIPLPEAVQNAVRAAWQKGKCPGTM